MELLKRRDPVAIGNVRRRDMLLGISTLLLSRGLVRAQDTQSSPQPTFSSDVKVVNTFFTVRDKKGRIVTNLNQGDFAIAENGLPKEIRYFSRQSDLPLTVGLIVDVTPSETNMLGVEQEASRQFLSQVLRPDKDRAFLIQFGDEVELLQDLTSSRAKLERALNELGTGQQEQDNGNRRGPNSRGTGRGPQGGGADSTALSDAITLASTDVLKSQTGRKALIVLGDGDHIGDREEQAMRSAQEADCLIYTVRIFDKDFGAGSGRGPSWRGLSLPGMGVPGVGGPGAGGPGMGGPGGRQGPGGDGPGMGGVRRSDGAKRLKEIAQSTGGSAFEVTKKESLGQIYGQIEEELRNQYSIGYLPDPAAESGFRRIDISTKQSGLTVHCRKGYYAGPSV